MNTLTDILHSYNERVASQNVEPGQKFLVFSIERHNPFFKQSRLVGGLADRLKGIISAFCLAVMTGRRFVIHWEEPVQIVRNLLPSKYDWRYLSSRKFINQNHSILHLELIDKSDELSRIDPDEIEATLFHDCPTVIININHFRPEPMIAFIQRRTGNVVSANALFGAVFQFLFRFNPSPLLDVERLHMDGLRQTLGGTVGVHLRTGAGNGWADPQMDDWRNYEKIMERAFSEAAARKLEDPVFLFFSDSPDARKAVAGRQWPHRVEATEEAISHLDRSDGIDERSNDITYFEFEALASSRLVVGGKGGFSQTAALSGGTPFIRYSD